MTSAYLYQRSKINFESVFHDLFDTADDFLVFERKALTEEPQDELDSLAVDWVAVVLLRIVEDHGVVIEQPLDVDDWSISPTHVQV